MGRRSFALSALSPLSRGLAPYPCSASVRMTIASIFEVVEFAIFNWIIRANHSQSLSYSMWNFVSSFLRGTSRRGSEVQCAISDGPWVRGSGQTCSVDSSRPGMATRERSRAQNSSFCHERARSAAAAAAARLLLRRRHPLCSGLAPLSTRASEMSFDRPTPC